MRISIRIATTLVAFVLCASAWAQKPSAYPAKGQGAEQKSKDDSQCLAWAKQDTGIDPAVVALVSLLWASRRDRGASLRITGVQPAVQRSFRLLCAGYLLEPQDAA